MEIFIKGNVPSSKNTKQWTGKFLVWSKNAQKYVRQTEDYWIENREIWRDMLGDKEFPIKVSFKFVRKSKHKFDYVNPLQTILDLMVKYKWLEDDNADIIKPVFEDYEYDKDNPGVYIKILD
jgi:hypothetical protein